MTSVNYLSYKPHFSHIQKQPSFQRRLGPTTFRLTATYASLAFPKWRTALNLPRRRLVGYIQLQRAPQKDVAGVCRCSSQQHVTNLSSSSTIWEDNDVGVSAKTKSGFSSSTTIALPNSIRSKACNAVSGTLMNPAW